MDQRLYVAIVTDLLLRRLHVSRLWFCVVVRSSLVWSGLV